VAEQQDVRDLPVRVTGETRTNGDGRVAFRLRIGVTGHRALPEGDDLAGSVQKVLARIREVVLEPKPAAASRTPVAFTVVSPLAEGSDRVVARLVLNEPEADLETPLPLTPEDYKQDFETQASKDEFDELFARASASPVAPPEPSRAQAYEQVGRHVVDRCDVLVAVWDGEPAQGRGGTGDTVGYADRRGVPIFVIDPTNGEITEDIGADGSRLRDLREEWCRIDGYNAARIPPRDFATAADASRDELIENALAAQVSLGAAERIADWLAPYTVRADLLAASGQRTYLRLTAAVFLLAALAVVTVTLQVLFWPEVPQLAIVELLTLVALLAIVVFGRWRQINRQFICDRFLAERLREAPYLVVAGLDRTRPGGFSRSYLGRRPEGWPWRAFAEVWNGCPRGDVVATDADALADVVADRWIGGQIGYHQKAAARNHLLHNLFIRGNVVLLGATIVAAVLHAAEFGGHHTDGLTWSNVLVFVSIALPALGGAISGVGAMREYARHAERSEHMVEYLEEAQRDVRAAHDLDALRTRVRETVDLMLAENRDWFGVLSFRDLEPHS
jgi:hypothetical protein